MFAFSGGILYSGSMKKLEMQRKVEAYLEKWNMAGPGMRLLVGFSGGADSTALLQFLWEYGREHEISVSAVHVNHGIRGAEALRDQEFCRQFCAQRGIPLEVICEDVPKIAKRQGISEEEAGRKVRYDIFEKYLAEGTANRIALAHHQNDQAETMLFRLMRGTGLRGLRGMEPVRTDYIRPFLCVTRREIEEWLLKKGISWVEDGTNQELEYTRNQIRHLVLSPMEQIRPGTAVRMAETAEQLLEIEDFMNQELAVALERSVIFEEGRYKIRLKPFGKLHPALQKMMIMRCLERLKGDLHGLEAVHAGQVCGLARGRMGSRIMLPGGIYAVLQYEEIILKQGYGPEKTEEQVCCEPPGEYAFLGTTFSFSLEDREKNEEIPVNRYTKWFDYDKIRQGLVLRTRRQGDYLENGRGSHKKLKDYLIDCKIPREERDGYILLADGSHIIWVVGMRISEAYKVTEQTRRVLKVQKIERGGKSDGELPY